MSDSETAFRGSYPIDFDFYDKDQQNVLYIEDRPADQQVKLEITNASAETIQLAKLPDSTVVGPAAYHFALRFRPGTLSDACLAKEDKINKIKLSADSAASWTMSDPVKDKNGMGLLYFLAKTQLSFEPQKKITIALLNVGADGAQGSRGARVELLYDHMHYQNTPTPSLKSTRIAHLSIINHRGKTHIPLHAGIVGSNTVLNDGKSSNSLKLRITNLQRPDAAHPGKDHLVFKYNVDEAKASKLILSFDTGDSSEEWALAAKTQVKAITVKQPGGWKKSEPKQGESPEWILQPESADQVLAGNKHLELTLSDIITGYPNGRTHLYLRCENIPGYWDGQLVCAIEKQPLVYRGDNVGIGTTDPQAKLDVKGTIFAGNSDFYFTKTDHKHTGIGNKVGHAAIENAEDHNALMILGRNTTDDPQKPNRVVKLWDYLQVNGNMNVTGNVGIGTTNPTHTFHVKTGDAVGLFESNGEQAYLRLSTKEGMDKRVEFCNRPGGRAVVWTADAGDALNVLKNGNVGIGTTNPKAKLEVNGSIKADGYKHTVINRIGEGNMRTYNLAIRDIPYEKLSSLSTKFVLKESTTVMAAYQVQSEMDLTVKALFATQLVVDGEVVNAFPDSKKWDPDGKRRDRFNDTWFGILEQGVHKVEVEFKSGRKRLYAGRLQLLLMGEGDEVIEAALETLELIGKQLEVGRTDKQTAEEFNEKRHLDIASWTEKHVEDLRKIYIFGDDPQLIIVTNLVEEKIWSHRDRGKAARDIADRFNSEKIQGRTSWTERDVENLKRVTKLRERVEKIRVTGELLKELSQLQNQGISDKDIADRFNSEKIQGRTSWTERDIENIQKEYIFGGGADIIAGNRELYDEFETLRKQGLSYKEIADRFNSKKIQGRTSWTEGFLEDLREGRAIEIENFN